jgi:hypothetical protein
MTADARQRKSLGYKEWGSNLSNAKKQQVLDAGLVPAFPEPH